MFLKSLALHGFKSFAQRVELTFPAGVSAVVGPNGSGKSNIADAIRWVLGEPNVRNLRGTALADVVFAGTDGRRPLGLAEVSLTLDNADLALPLDYHEVTVTRRVYRSGDSEFFLNRTACRLRDIHELFMDTGLGRGSLSLIGQGEVDAVLSAKPDERRLLIEEAAGITRYRAKRRAALERLLETEQSLTRVADIISEVARQLSPLEREAERAREHKEVSRRLQEVDRTLLRVDWGKRKAAWQASQAKADAASVRRDAARRRLADAQEAVASAAAERERLEGELRESEGELTRLERTAQERSGQLEVLRERLAGLKADGARRAELVTQMRSELAAHKEAQSAWVVQSAEAEETVAEARALLDAAEAEILAAKRGIEAKEAALQDARTQTLARFEDVADAQSELQRAQQAVAHWESEWQRRRAEFDETSEQAARAGEKRAEREAEVAELQGQERDLQTGLTQKESQLKAVEEERRRLVQIIEQASGNVAKIRSQIDALRDLEASYEGFQDGVRACLAAKEPWRAGVLGDRKSVV